MYTMAYGLLQSGRIFEPAAQSRGTVDVRPLSPPEPFVTETVAEIVAAHRAGRVSPKDTVARSFQRIRDHGDPAIFISLRDEAEAIAEAERLTDSSLPLYGVPVA